MREEVAPGGRQLRGGRNFLRERPPPPPPPSGSLDSIRAVVVSLKKKVAKKVVHSCRGPSASVISALKSRAKRSSFVAVRQTRSQPHYARPRVVEGTAPTSAGIQQKSSFFFAVVAFGVSAGRAGEQLRGKTGSPAVQRSSLQRRVPADYQSASRLLRWTADHRAS